MRFLTDCPVILSEWREFAGEAKEAAALSGGEERLWRALSQDRRPWEMEVRERGLSEGIAVIMERSNTSQFDAVHELMNSDSELPPCFVAVALDGENFHGQSGRPWLARSGNLHLTAYFRAGLAASGIMEAISITPTLAVLDAFEIRANAGERTGIRWVNDVFVRGRKLSGSIAVSQVEGERLDGLLFGIGVNVETIPAVPGDVFVPEATSLRSAFPEAGWTLGRSLFALLKALAARMEELRDGKARQLVEVYANHSACVGREVKIWPKHAADATREAPMAVGRLSAIAPDLSVRVTGHEEAVPEGRLAFAEDCVRLGL